MPGTGPQHRPGGGRGTIALGERRGVWLLEVQGRRIELREGETTVGRSRGCGVVVKDPSVSRGHALLSVHGDRVTVQDLQSSNGTYLNGRRLEAETPMAEGDRLTVGETQAYLRLSRDGARRPAPAAGEGPHFCPFCGVPVEAETTRCPGCGRDLAGERLPRRSEAIGMGEVLPVGEVLGASSDAWDLTSPPGLAAAAKEGRLPPAPPRPAERLPVLGGPGPFPLPEPPELRRFTTADTPSLTAAVVAWRPAGFWIRAAAWLLDAAAVALVSALLSLPFGGPRSPRGSLVASAAAFVLGLLVPLVGWSLWGTTPGKRALGLVVVGPGDRRGLPVGRAVLRLVGYFLSALPFGAGFWIAGISPEKRTLHDHLAGTSVLRSGR